MAVVSPDSLNAMLEREAARFVAPRPRSRNLHARAQESMMGGAPVSAREAHRPWCVTRIGARAECRFRPNPPRIGGAAQEGVERKLDRLILLYFLNRGILVTPFHNMLLISPDTTADDVDRHTAVSAECAGELTGRSA